MCASRRILSVPVPGTVLCMSYHMHTAEANVVHCCMSAAICDSWFVILVDVQYGSVTHDLSSHDSWLITHNPTMRRGRKQPPDCPRENPEKNQDGCVQLWSFESICWGQIWELLVSCCLLNISCLKASSQDLRFLYYGLQWCTTDSKDIPCPTDEGEVSFRWAWLVLGIALARPPYLLSLHCTLFLVGSNLLGWRIELAAALSCGEWLNCFQFHLQGAFKMLELGINVLNNHDFVW